MSYRNGNNSSVGNWICDDLTAVNVTSTNRITQDGAEPCNPSTIAEVETGTNNTNAITPSLATYFSYRSWDKTHGIAYGFGQNVSGTGPIDINSGGNFQTSDLVIGTTTYTINSGKERSYLVQAFVEFTLDNGENITLGLISSGNIRTTTNATTNASGSALEYNKTLTGIIDVADSTTPTISINVSTVTGTVSISASSYIIINEL